MRISPLAIALSVSSLNAVSAFVPNAHSLSALKTITTSSLAHSQQHDEYIASFTGDFLFEGKDEDSAVLSGLAKNKFGIAPFALTMLPLEDASAADGSAVSNGQLASAFAAYGHYLSLFAIVACLVTERLTVKPNMTDEEEDRLAIADTTLGISGALLAYTGYLRTTADWGKGFDYYAHEPVFWLKTFFVAIFGAVSFFPTTKIIQRSIDKRNGKLIPMSPELAKRMTSLINAELLMVGSIPLTATLMARGVGYWQDFPWQAGAAATVGALGGLGFKYVKEALDWKEPQIVEE